MLSSTIKYVPGIDSTNAINVPCTCNGVSKTVIDIYV